MFYIPTVLLQHNVRPWKLTELANQSQITVSAWAERVSWGLKASGGTPISLRPTSSKAVACCHPAARRSIEPWSWPCWHTCGFSCDAIMR